MFGRGYKIARIAGIDVTVSPWWLVMVALFTWVLGASYYPSVVHGIAPAASYALGLLSILLLFASILAHEFGHALVARRCGLEIEEIELWLLGGVSKLRGRTHRPVDELRFALAGPAVTAIIAAIFGALALALPASTPAAVKAVIDYQAEINLVLLAFNLVPAFPLDGGRVTRALLWWRRDDIASATNTAAGIGRAFGWLMVLLGIFSWMSGVVDGIFLALIGGFVVIAAGAEQTQEQLLATFAGVSVRELMSTPAVTISAASTLDDAARTFERHRFASLPVTDAAGTAVGLLSIEQLERLPHSDERARVAGDLADRDPELLVDEHDDVTYLLERPTFARTGRAIVVDASKRPIGLVSRTDIHRAIRATGLRHDPGSGRELTHHHG